MSDAAAWKELLRGGLFAKFALLLLGVWLNAADALVTVTVMPSVAKEIGGYAYFGWATAVFLLGAITAGASSGALGRRIGLRAAMTGAGLIYAFGCICSALSPGIAAFLLARLAQGLGAGWIVGLVFVAVGSVFPAGQWARAMAATTSVWGAATLLGPMLGGLFAAAGPDGWRGVFWFFAVQGVAFAVAAWRLLPAAPPRAERDTLPWRQLLILAAGVMALASAGLARGPLFTLALTLIGLVLLALMIRMDAGAPAAMLPRATRNLRCAAGAGYLTIFLLEGGASGWSIYGAAMIQVIYRTNPWSRAMGWGAWRWDGPWRPWPWRAFSPAGTPSSSARGRVASSSAWRPSPSRSGGRRFWRPRARRRCWVRALASAGRS
jgi:MFS family permease